MGRERRGMRGRGRMLVTGATLIHSSSSSLKRPGSYDRLNTSRDVTFPASLKELEPALFLSCLILFSRFYDKQTRTGWGQERERQRDRGRQGGGQVYAVRGTRCLCKLALCLFHKGLEMQVQIKTWNLPSRIARIVHWIQFIWLFRSPDHAFKCTVVR